MARRTRKPKRNITESSKAPIREVLIRRMAEAEQFPYKRIEWPDLLLPGDPLYEQYQSFLNYECVQNSGGKPHSFIHRYFKAHELDEIEYAAVQRRIGSYGPRVTALLEELWNRGMDGDTQAAKEFLNRILGAPNQKVYFEHHAGDSLQQLLDRISPSEAYQQPELDENGNEIIEIEDFTDDPG